MTELTSNDKRKIAICQGDWEGYHEAVRARVAAEGYQTPPLSPEDSPITPQEHAQLFLNDLTEAEPPGVLAAKALKAVASIPEEISYLASAVEARPDYSNQLTELIEAIKEHNRLHREEEPPEDTTQGSRPLKPSPTSQGGSKPRREVSPGLKRLRQLEKGGS